MVNFAIVNTVRSLFFARHERGVVLRAERQDDTLLHGGTLRHLLVHDFPRDVVHIERHVALVPDFRVEIQKPVVRVDAFQKVLDAETLAADMLHLTLVLLVDGLHDKAHQHRAFTAQLFQVDFLRVVRAVHRLAVMDEVAHLHVEQQRFGGVLHVEGVKLPSSVITDMLVSFGKFLTVAFTRMTFSAPSALPAIRSGEPKST